ncbi:MAG: hypothetical protein A2X12_08590 [Bacteroidetes bacterium GWE2_29_8]|nr:MAG: hypothetical protein A2X12_08590 [Bacteroidetes bacterium GWE2_29_8]
MKKIFSFLLLLLFLSALIEAQELSAYEYLVKGNNKFSSEDYSGAIIDYSNSLLQDSLESAGQFDNDSLKTVILSKDTIKINKTDVYYYIAASKTHMGSFNEALSYYNKLISIDSNYTNVFYNRGVVKFYLKDYKGALSDFDISIIRQPSLIESHEAKTIIRMRDKKYESVIVEAGAGIAKSSIEYNLYYYRGLAKFYLYNYSEAVEDFNLAIENKPDFDKAYYNRGLSFYRLSKYSEACLDWEKADNLGYNKAGETLNELCKQR